MALMGIVYLGAGFTGLNFHTGHHMLLFQPQAAVQSVEKFIENQEYKLSKVRNLSVKRKTRRIYAGMLKLWLGIIFG